MRYKHTNLVTRDRRKTAGRWLNKGAGLTDAVIKGVQIRLPGHGDSGPTIEIFHYARHLPQPPLVANRLGFGHIAFEVAAVAATLKNVIAMAAVQCAAAPTIRSRAWAC